MNTVINCDLSEIQPQIIIYDFIDGNLNPFVFAVRRCVRVIALCSDTERHCVRITNRNSTEV